MLKNMTTKRQRRGREVVQEAAEILRQMRFCTNRGAYLKGQHVSILVDPRWNEENQTIRVFITCHARGPWEVDWEGLPVFVLPESGESGWIRFLNARGQVVFPSLPPGDYRLSTSSLHGRSAEPVLQPARARALAAHSATGTMDIVPSESRVCESDDGRVRATIRQRGDKTIAEFETNDEVLSGATVRFAFVQESGRVEQSAEVKLEPVEDKPGLWEGRWEEFVKLSKPCKLVFELLTEGK